MDKAVFVPMSGATETIFHQTIGTSNLANNSTPGFRAAFADYHAIPVYGDGHPTKAYAGAKMVGYDFTPGPIKYTGNPLDVSIVNEGWLTVQLNEDQEGYTRRGDLRIENGTLVNGADQKVIGEGGPINIPPYQNIEITNNGSIYVTPINSKATILIGKLKLTNPNTDNITKDPSGTFVTKDGAVAETDLSVKLQNGGYEQSNVNNVKEMVNILNSSRKYEFALKTLSKFEENSEATDKLVSLG